MFINHSFYAIQEGPLTLLELGVSRRRNPILSGTVFDPYMSCIPHAVDSVQHNFRIINQSLSQTYSIVGPSVFGVFLMGFSPA